MLIDFLKEVMPYLIGSGGLVFYVLSIKERKANIKATEATAEQTYSQSKVTDTTALQELQKAYREYVIDNEKVLQELRNEISNIKIELKKYVNQCTLCPNNKIK